MRLLIVYVCSVLSLQPDAEAEANKAMDFKGLCIYGLMTNFTEFKFYSYHPSTNQFYYDETIIVNNQRTIACADMMNGTYLSPLQ